MTTTSKRQRARLYILKIKKNAKCLYIYIIPATWQKARQFALRLYIQKPRHFKSHNFHENFEIGIYIQKP